MVFALSFLIISYLQVLSSKFIKSNHCCFSIYSFHAFLYIPFILHLSVYPVGVRGTLIGRLGMIHAGQLIERTLHEQGRTVTWFAGQLCCTRPNIYKIFKKENIDIHLLWRISCILDHDFFRDLSDNIRIGTSSCVSK